jgi:Tfp pilus assembly protein FimT
MVKPAQGRRAHGYTFIEVLFGMGLMSVIGSMAMMHLGGSQPSAKGDDAMRVIVAQLNTARSLSISQRRQMEVQFVAPNQVRIVRHEPANATTVISTVSLQGGLEYGSMAEAPDTPDGFGNRNATGVNFGSASSIGFASNGTLVDETRNPRSGSVFFRIPNEAQSLRAVTITGDTGRIRGYKWDATKWSGM